MEILVLPFDYYLRRFPFYLETTPSLPPNVYLYISTHHANHSLTPLLTLTTLQRVMNDLNFEYFPFGVQRSTSPQFVPKKCELAQGHNDLYMATLYFILRCAQALALRIEIVPRT